MKKFLLIIIAGLSAVSVQSQEVTDALRYAQDNFNGTARFRAMSGAFGALGGDLSAINVNPAGSAIFTKIIVGATIGSYNTKNKSNYFGTKTSENNYNVDLNQAGGVYIFNNEDEASDWKKFALSANYENNNNFDNSIFSAGTNPTNSIDNYFLNYANGVKLSIVDGSDYNYGDLYYNEQQAYLGYQAYIINPVDDTNANNTLYTSNVPAGGNYYHENSFETSGYNGKVNFNFASEYKDFLYLGINLNAHFTEYRQATSFYERNNNNQSADIQVNRLRFNNDLYTYGSGFSFQLGAIAKVTKEFRVGLAYESPTWYRLNDELRQSLVSVSGSTAGELSPDVVDPNLIMVYETYKLQTPGKVTGSLAYIFGKEGLISLDVAMKDYSNTRFLPKEDFINVNNSLGNLLDNALEYRIGAEKRYKEWSFRAGYRLEESPYKNKKTMGDLTGYSGGLGYNFGKTKVDVAYSYSKRDYQQQFFAVGLTDSAKINSVNNNVSVTLLFEVE